MSDPKTTPITPASALDRAAEAFRAEMKRQDGGVSGVGEANSYVDIEDVDDRAAAAAVVLAFLRALPMAGALRVSGGIVGQSLLAAVEETANAK